MDLLERRALGERAVLVLGGEVDGAADRAHRALAVVGEALGAQAGDERQVRRVAGLEALERLAVRRREVRVAERDERRRLALGDVDEDGAGQPARERARRRSTGRRRMRARAASRSSEKTLAPTAMPLSVAIASAGRRSLPTTSISVTAKRGLVIT